MLSNNPPAARWPFGSSPSEAGPISSDEQGNHHVVNSPPQGTDVGTQKGRKSKFQDRKKPLTILHDCHVFNHTCTFVVQAGFKLQNVSEHDLELWSSCTCLLSIGMVRLHRQAQFSTAVFKPRRQYSWDASNFSLYLHSSLYCDYIPTQN